jgi:hypothetical protein
MKVTATSTAAETSASANRDHKPDVAAAHASNPNPVQASGYSTLFGNRIERASIHASAALPTRNTAKAKACIITPSDAIMTVDITGSYAR